MKCRAKTCSFIILLTSFLKQRIFGRWSRILTNIICTFLNGNKMKVMRQSKMHYDVLLSKYNVLKITIAVRLFPSQQREELKNIREIFGWNNQYIKYHFCIPCQTHCLISCQTEIFVNKAYCLSQMFFRKSSYQNFTLKENASSYYNVTKHSSNTSWSKNIPHNQLSRLIPKPSGWSFWQKERIIESSDVKIARIEWDSISDLKNQCPIV